LVLIGSKKSLGRAERGAFTGPSILDSGVRDLVVIKLQAPAPGAAVAVVVDIGALGIIAAHHLALDGIGDVA